MKPKVDKRAKRQRVKALKKLTKMAKKGKLRRHLRDQVEEVRRQKMAPQQRQMAEIRKDWIVDRSVQDRDCTPEFDEAGAVPPPMDSLLVAHHMFRTARRPSTNNDSLMGEDELEEKLRSFVSMDGEDEELLPVKIDGKLVKRVKSSRLEEENQLADEDMEEVKTMKDADEEEGDKEDIKKEINWEGQKEEADIDKLSKKELSEHKQRLEAMAEHRLANAADTIVTVPEENVLKFSLLLRMSAGKGESPLVREHIQKLAVASLTELFINVLPGYRIRTLTESEKSQKMKKETKRLANYEHALLDYYTKFLGLLEKSSNKLISKEKKPVDESTFFSQFGFLCTRCLCRLVEKLPHFNHSESILACLVRLAFSSWQKILNEVCSTISRVFSEDLRLKLSLHGVKAIALHVNKKAGYVPPDLILTFLALNISEIDRMDGAKTLKGQRKQINVRNSKRARKYQKQIGKIDAELKEAIVAEKHSTKLKLATETMKYVFLTYCRILKRMATTQLFGPVLEGLSKFANLINVELYDDLSRHLGKLVEQKQLKLSELLLCVRTAATILSGEGQLLDVDMLKFHRALFSSLQNLCFQPGQSFLSDLPLLVECVQLLFVRRRKTISLARVGAFVKRIALVSLPLRTRPQMCLLLLLRRLLIAYSGLHFMILTDEDDEDNTVGGASAFRPNSSDPDHSNSMGTTIVEELKLFSNHPNATIRSIALNLLEGMPLTGRHRMEAKWANSEPDACLTVVEDDAAFFLQPILNFCKIRKQTYCSATLCSVLCNFLADRRKRKTQQ